MPEYEPEIIGVIHTPRNFGPSMKMIDILASEGVKKIGLETEMNESLVKRIFEKLYADPRLAPKEKEFLKQLQGHLEFLPGYWRKIESHAREKGLEVAIIDSESLHATELEITLRSLAKKGQNVNRSTRFKFRAEQLEDAPSYVRENLRERKMEIRVRAQRPQAIMVGTVHATNLADALKIPFNKITLIKHAKIMRPPKMRLARRLDLILLTNRLRRFRKERRQKRREIAKAIGKRAVRRP